MILRTLLLACALLVLGWPGALEAQGLGDFADRERARRTSEAKDEKAEPAVYTDHDLKAYRPPDADDDDDDEGDDGSGGGGRDSDSEDEDEEDEEDPVEAERRRADRQRVRGRTDPNRAQRDDASRAQAEVDQLQARIRTLNGKLNPMSRDYIYGQAQSVDAANQEIQIRQELTQLEGALTDARQDLVEAKSELSDADRGGYNPQDDE